jgi:nucleoside-diphosphate-sugar epimerase
MFAEREGLMVNVFRPFSGYGADQDLAYPFPSFIKRGLLRTDPFPIWGDGEQVRDFIHISDIVDAVTAALHEGVTGPVNLGWGRPTSFNELARMVADEVGCRPALQHDLGAPVGVRYRVCDPTRLLAFYTPKVTLEEGIRRSITEFGASVA